MKTLVLEHEGKQGKKGEGRFLKFAEDGAPPVWGFSREFLTEIQTNHRELGE